MSWTIEHASSQLPKNGQWDIMIVQNETEAFEQTRKYIDAGLIVNAIRKPDGTVAYTQDQVYARYHGFDDEAVKRGERNLPRNWQKN